MDHPSNLLWIQQTWLEQASCWIDHQLHRQGIKRIGLLEQPHIRHWSTVLRVPTSNGNIYFKAVIPDLAYEAALTQNLSSWYPHCVPQILAAQRKYGWLLMAEGGVRLRETLKTDDDLQHWESLLPIYAQLQKESIKHLNNFLELGVPDRRLTVLPTQFQALLTDTEVLRLNYPDGLSSEEYQRLQDSADLLARLCEKLATFSIPETLDHGDLHDGNVFLRDGLYRFFDWGDSSLSHPFFTLPNTFASLEKRFGLDQRSFWFKRMRACYLESWSEFETRENLEAAFDLAQHLSAIPSALRWLPVLANMDELTRHKYVEAIPNLLRELLSRIKAH